MWLIPRKAVKSEFIVLVFISIHVPEKSGNYKPRVYFSPLWVCINVEEKCSQCFTSPPLLWLHSVDAEGRVFYFAAFLYTSRLCSHPTHVRIWDIFCCRAIILDSTQPNLLCRLASQCKIIIICRTNTVKLCLRVTIFCVTNIQCGFMCMHVYINASANCCRCIQAQVKHGWTWSFGWMMMCGNPIPVSLNKKKQHISQAADRRVLPAQHLSETHPRQAKFVGPFGQTTHQLRLAQPIRHGQDDWLPIISAFCTIGAWNGSKG